jgi:hypothetical protein
LRCELLSVVGIDDFAGGATIATARSLLIWNAVDP